MNFCKLFVRPKTTCTLSLVNKVFIGQSERVQEAPVEPFLFFISVIDCSNMRARNT